MDRKSKTKWFWKWLRVFDSREISGAPGQTRTGDPLLRRQTLYPTELRAHPWQLHYSTLLMPQLQVLVRVRFWSILEQHKREHRTPRRLFPLPGVFAPVPHPCGNTILTSTLAYAPSKNC